MEHLTNYTEYLGQIKGLSKNTIQSYFNDLYFFLSWAHAIDERFASEDITEGLINSYFIGNTDWSASTRKRKVSAIRQYCKYLYHRGALKCNVAQYVSSPKLGQALPKVEDYATMAQAIDAINDVKLRCICALCLHSGLRINEALSIKRTDIRKERMTIIIHGKGNKEREVRYNEKTRDYLNTWAKGKTGREIFPNSDDRQIRYEIYKALGCAPHTLRHTFATHMLIKGCPLTSLQMMLGHSSVTITERYTHISNTLISEHYGRFN